MRNPNGYGTVVKLSGNRRKPYAVRKTVGHNDNGNPVFSCLGYYASRKDALMALAEYNANPYDINRSKFTFKELYEEWSDIVLSKFQYSQQKSLTAAYSHCKPLYDLQYKSIKRYQMQECIDTCGLSTATQSNIRLLFIKLDAYAYEMDIINKQYSQLLTVSDTKQVREHVPFTNEEIKVIIKENIPEVLFMLYTGMRITEVATLPSACIHDGVIQYGIKTKAGKDRIIPIHPAIQQIIEERMGNELLFNTNTNGLHYLFRKYMKQLGMNHLPHDCRHTFRSELDRQGANKVCIDLLMGHVSAGTGERVYTHKTIEELKNTIMLLYPLITG